MGVELLMILYTEKQLEVLYRIYARHQNRNGIAFMKLENFRDLFEEQQSYLMGEINDAS